jgi:hypothetical protein
MATAIERLALRRPEGTGFDASFNPTSPEASRNPNGRVAPLEARPERRAHCSGDREPPFGSRLEAVPDLSLPFMDSAGRASREDAGGALRSDLADGLWRHCGDAVSMPSGLHEGLTSGAKPALACFLVRRSRREGEQQ